METVMIIDDESNVLRDVKSILENEYNVITVDSIRKAHELIEEMYKDIGLILLKSNIPDTEIPAFFSMKPDMDKKMNTTKIDDFLIKPFTRNQLFEFVKNKLR